MEEKRDGQAPEAEIAESGFQTAQRTAAPGSNAERDSAEDHDILEDAQAKAEADKKRLRRAGFGDHKGGDIS